MVIVMKVIKNCLISIYFILLLVLIYLKIFTDFKVGIVEIIIPVIFLFFPSVMKLIKVEMKEYIKVIYYFFFIAAYILGVGFKLYYNTNYFDLIIHFLFGFLGGIVTHEYLHYHLKLGKLYNFILFCIILALGCCWEIFEFIPDFFFHTDNQQKSTGLTDTMTDLIVSVIGVIVYLIIKKFLQKTNKRL